ncbi:MAG: hypothetical protein J6S06_00925 [Alphaproteobacteria bacterium]|nr:hypothetical protein [Alphaproteobacteria bacterium]
MKIKNIMFSGFTAVILAGVCGASNAATVSLISKNYADTNLQAKLTQGENITISEDNTISAVIPDAVVDSTELKAVEDALNAAIAEKQEKGDYLTAESLTELNDAVTALQSGKADVATVTALQNAINGLGETYATKADMSAADTALQNAIDAIDLTPYAKTADVEAGLALKEDVSNKVADMTAEQIEAMSSTDKATKYPSISVAQTIANAAVTKVNEVAGDLSTLQTQVGTNTADIAEIKGAGYQDADDVKATVEGYGYQTADQVSGAITTATADLATKADTLAGYGITDAYTKSEVDSAIGAIKEYDDTALAGRVTANEGAITDNAGAITALETTVGDADSGLVKGVADNAGAITALETTVGDADSGLVKGVADNASAIEALQGAGYVVGTKTAGSYLVNFDANGNASYAAVEILDDKGAPIDLTVGAVK